MRWKVDCEKGQILKFSRSFTAFSLDLLRRTSEQILTLRGCGEGHVHDESVSSVGFTLGPDEQLNLFALKMWISELLRTYNEELFRYKGVIAVKGMDNK